MYISVGVKVMKTKRPMAKTQIYITSAPKRMPIIIFLLD